MSAVLKTDVPSATRLPHDDPPWTRPALGMLLAGTAGLYLWNLSASGYANTFYSAAAQAGSRSVEAFLFGSSDAANVMTVDKPPVFLWPMDLSVRLFGLNSWSLLAPQVLLAVVSVFLLFRMVKRSFGAGAGLIAGVVLALTPVAALMFRYDNPDAMLTFLLLAVAWSTLRALADQHFRWLVAAGVILGFAFLTKELAVTLIVPGLIGAYLLAAPGARRRRLIGLAVAGGAAVVSAGWWIALVEWLPATSRPYIGGSTDNSFLSVVLGGNGFDRIVGASRTRAGSTSAGVTRLFSGESAAQIGWLLPSALAVTAGAVVVIGRRPRTDPQRAMFVLLTGWLLVSMAVYSVMTGIYHDYYTVSIAPAVAGLVAGGVSVLWRVRDRRWVRGLLTVVVAGTGIWSFVLLGRSAPFVPWLRWVVLVLAVGLAVVGAVHRGRRDLSRRTLAATVAVLGVIGLAGPAAYVVQTVTTAHTGASPQAGPAVTGAGVGAAAGLFGAVHSGDNKAGVGRNMGSDRDNASLPASTSAGQALSDLGSLMGVALGHAVNVPVRAAVVGLLGTDAAAYRWVAATTGATSAAGYQLATQLPVIGIGGYGGAGAAPTLEQFQQDVADRQVHYYLAVDEENGFSVRAAPNYPATRIEQWVAAHYRSESVDGVTVYDLTAPAAP